MYPIWDNPNEHTPKESMEKIIIHPFVANVKINCLEVCLLYKEHVISSEKRQSALLVFKGQMVRDIIVVVVIVVVWLWQN
jgi:hypothetical protein